MKKLLAIGLFTSLLLSSCGNDASTTPNTDNETGNGYFPLTVGSSWDYEHNDHDILLYSTKKITGDTIINGRKYAKYVSVSEGKESKPRLYRRSNDTLYFFDRTAEVFFYVEKKGATWTSFYAPDSVTTVFTVPQQGISRTVGGITYPDVLQLHTSSIRISDGKTYTSEQDHYYAKNIGMIEAVLEEQYVMTLTKYVVK